MEYCGDALPGWLVGAIFTLNTIMVGLGQGLMVRWMTGRVRARMMALAQVFFVVGYAVFGVSIFILLWQTIGTLLSQSLFFLVAGVALLGLAAGAHKLANWSRSGVNTASGSAA